MVSSWLPRSVLLLGLLSASSAAAAAAAGGGDSDSDGAARLLNKRRESRLRAAASKQAEAATALDADLDADLDPVDIMIQDRKAGRNLKKDKKGGKNKKKSGGSKKKSGGSKKDYNADKQKNDAQNPTTSTAGTFKQTNPTTIPNPPTTGTSTGTTSTGQTFTLPPGVTGYNNSPNGYYQGTSSGANTENNFQTWTVKDPSQVGRNPGSGGGTVANVQPMSCEGGGGDNQDMTFFGVKFGQCSKSDPCLAAVMPSRMAYYCPLQYRPYCGGKCYTIESACPDGKIHDAVGGVWDARDPRWWQAESSAWGGAWPLNFMEPACTHSAASF